jgi:hypothetical protein
MRLISSESSGTDSTLKKRMPALKAIMISSSVLPTEAKTIFLGSALILRAFFKFSQSKQYQNQPRNWPMF